MEKLLTIKEIAEAEQVQTKTVRAWIKRKKLWPVIRQGNGPKAHIRIEPAVYEKFLDKRRSDKGN